MLITFDDATDALYLYLREGVPVARSVVVDEDRTIDFGPDNQPVGVEVLGASTGVHLDDVVPKFDLWEYEAHFRAVAKMHFAAAEFA
jgi:uncharacterized protein YuzE